MEGWWGGVEWWGVVWRGEVMGIVERDGVVGSGMEGRSGRMVGGMGW